MKPGKITVLYDRQHNEVEITADEEGLRYLADICLRIIGKSDPAGHFHLMEKMGNLEKGSVNTVIRFDGDAPDPIGK